jgi:SOS response regulatory protein OraA/RecX
MNAKLDARIVVAMTRRGYAGERFRSAVRAVAASKGT